MKNPKVITKVISAKPPLAVGTQGNSFTAIASTQEMDRDRDHIQSWEVANFLKNPVMLFQHDQSRPIGRITSIEDRGTDLKVTFQITEGTTDGDEALKFLKSGAVRALSIGFTSVGDVAANDKGGIDYERVEIHEISLVTIPANPAALAASAGGKNKELVEKAQLLKAWEIRPMVRKEVWSSTLAELMDACGVLDSVGLVLRMKHDSKFRAQVEEVRDGAYAVADQVADAILDMPELVYPEKA